MKRQAAGYAYNLRLLQDIAAFRAAPRPKIARYKPKQPIAESPVGHVDAVKLGRPSPSQNNAASTATADVRTPPVETPPTPVADNVVPFNCYGKFFHTNHADDVW